MCNSFYYLRGGAERCFLELEKLLTDHGHEVIPFCMQDERNLPSPYAPYFFSNIDFPSRMRQPGLRPKLEAVERTIYSREAARKVKALIAATKPDIAHIHGIAHETSPSILPAIKAAGMPIVQTLHDYKLLCPNTSFVTHGEVCERCKGHHYYNVITHRCKRDSLAASLLAGVEMYIHKALQIYERNVDHFIAPSQFLRDKVVDYAIQTPITQIPNFIDVTAIEPCYDPQDYFVYCGRLVNVKGIKTLVEAMKGVGRSHLYIAGHGDLEAELQTYIAREQLTNITFLGHLQTAELLKLVRGAAFMVVPSEWYENYSMTVLEAFACGTPVLGAAIGGIPEQVNEGKTGLLFPPGNVAALRERINYLLDHRDVAVAMGQQARAQVEVVNDPQAHYEQTVALYRALCAG